MSPQSIWNIAHRQAAHIPHIKNSQVKARQIVMLCETLKKAMEKK